MPNPYAKACSGRSYGGTILADNKEIGNTIQCVHCGNHFLMVRGSGVTRGWCMRCNGIVCGPQCSECVPFDRQLEIMEGKLRRNALPVSVSVPATIGS